MASATVALPNEKLNLSPVEDEGLPTFPADHERKDFPIVGADGRLKTRTEIWLGLVLLYVREYDEGLYGDPS